MGWDGLEDPDLHLQPLVTYQAYVMVPIFAAEQTQRWPIIRNQGEGAPLHNVQDKVSQAFTTVYVSNLPEETSRDTFLSMMDAAGFQAAYDFVYLACDLASQRCLGFAFVNLVDEVIALDFVQRFPDIVQRQGISCSASWSKPHQGLVHHIERYRNSPLMHAAVPEVCRPVLFHGGHRVLFPRPTRSIKAPRYKKSPYLERSERSSE